MIHLFKVGLDLIKFNMDYARIKESKQAFQEVTLMVKRPDGLVEEKSRKLSDFLEFFGYEVEVIEPKKPEHLEDVEGDIDET